MSKPRYKRRKEDRPAEITEAALEAFAEQGYSGTRVDDVARRAGVSKGLLYLYFKTKEDLFKAVIRSFVSPKIDSLIRSVEDTELSAEEFLRGPFADFAKTIPRSPARLLIHLMITEGPKHPDLVKWYWENIVSRGIKALGQLIRRGIEAEEFRDSAIKDYPHLLVAPVFFALIFKQLFSAHSELDTDQYIDAHIDTVLRALKVQAI